MNKLFLEDARKFSHLELLAQEVVEGFITGLHKSPYHGFSVEFAEHKLYNFGESTRHVDWKLYSRTDRLYTKEFEEETNLRCTILLDISGSMKYPEPGHDKMAFSLYASAALCNLLISQRDAVGLISFDEAIRQQTVQKSTKTHLNHLLTYLDFMLKTSTQSLHTTNISQMLHLVADKIHKRSLVILFSDLLQPNVTLTELFAALQHLKHKRHEVLLFHITDKSTEIDFKFPDRPYEFTDPESGKSIKVSPSFVRDSFRKTATLHLQNIKEGCGRLKINLVSVDTSMPFDTVLTSYLAMRKKMH